MESSQFVNAAEDTMGMSFPPCQAGFNPWHRLVAASSNRGGEICRSKVDQMNAVRNIIVIDDEPSLRLMLNDYLTRQGFAVRTGEGGAALDILLRAAPADVIVLDINMPSEDGITIAHRLRENGNRAGILMLTAVGDEESRVTALGRGADDYLTKPFALSELLARIRSILRRLPEQEQQLPEKRLTPFGHCRLDEEGQQLIGPDGTEIALSSQEFQLLSVFARHPRQILSRDRLCALAYGHAPEGDNRSIDIRITRLRQKIELNPSSPRLIRTVRGEGYVFNPDIQDHLPEDKILK
jgi:DNA-binding response OmpR family regulator